MILPPATVGTTDEQLDAILERNRLDPDPDPPVIVAAEYNDAYDLFVLKLDDKSRLILQRELLEGLENATTGQLAHIELLGPGTAISWPDLDVAHYLPHLLERKFSSEEWKEARKQQAVAA